MVAPEQNHIWSPQSIGHPTDVVKSREAPELLKMSFKHFFDFQIEGVTLQQQQQPQQQGVASSAVTQSVTTLLKAVSPAASLSTVTIPVSAVSLGINVTHPKLVSGMSGFFVN